MLSMTIFIAAAAAQQTPEPVRSPHPETEVKEETQFREVRTCRKVKITGNRIDKKICEVRKVPVETEKKD